MESTAVEPKSLVSARVPREQFEELQRRADADDRSVSWYVRQAVDRYLEREEKEANSAVSRP